MFRGTIPLLPLVGSTKAIGVQSRCVRSAVKCQNNVSTSPSALPSQARVVVIGGGVIGTSVAYHLGKLGWGKDVILLERDLLTSGTTWHAAGLINTFGSLSHTATELRQYTRDLYTTLEEETGQATGFMPVGFIELAADADRLEEYRRVSVFNRHCGVDVQEISAQEVQALFPLCNVDDVLAGFYVAGDGRANPVDVTMALAKGAKMRGVTVAEHAPVHKVLTTTNTFNNRRVAGVEVAQGDGTLHTIHSEIVVNCTGMWACELAAELGVTVPNQAAEHYYLLTDAIPEVDPTWPVIEDPGRCTYIRPEGGGLMVGLFESDAAAWHPGKKIPADFSFGEIEPDWHRMGPFVEAAMERVPRSLSAGVKKLFCGPESFTPDRAPAVGEAPTLKNYFVAAGMNSIGILSGGGIGRVLAQWITTGAPDVDVTHMNVDRFQRYQLTPSYRRERVAEQLGNVYVCHYPHQPVESARNIKRSPVHDRLTAKHASFRDVSGWEGADFYAPSPTHSKSPGPLSWGRHHWFPHWAHEHAACRDNVVLMDMSFMSKFLVQGRDAGRFLNRLSTANVDGACGTITYTQWLNAHSGLEADLTVSKLTADKFMVVASDNMHGHTLAHMQKHLAVLMEEDPQCAHVFITDVTGTMAQLNVQGPASRRLLQAVSSSDLSNDAFPFRAVRDVDIGCALATCARISYVGELGYELFIPAESAAHVYDAIVAEGETRHGLVHAGLKALSSLRLEKAYRDYGHDMDNLDALVHVGLSFTCDFEKPGGFIGQDATQTLKSQGLPTRRLLQILVQDPEPLLFHGEVVVRNGRAVGDVRAASYGHTLGGAVGLAMIADECKINKNYIDDAEWHVDIGGTQYPIAVSARPMYDPTNERMHC
eukprot:m.917961 g.917961  ORF g.917961 m.917961 type:complete len:877 (+) comp23739_c0_seq7:230-2860(+)